MSQEAGSRAAGQDGPSAPRQAANSGYGQGADLPGGGYSWTDQAASPSSGGYQPGYGRGDNGAAWPEDDLAAGYRWAADDQSADAWPGAGLRGQATIAARSNAVRGFAPAPDEPLPVYPPGPFAAWNRQPAGDRGTAGSRRPGRPDSSGQLSTATITPDEFDTDYSLPAITDPIPGRDGKDAAGDGSRAARGGTGTRGAGTGPGRVARHGAGPGEAARRGTGAADTTRPAAGPGTSGPGTRGRRASGAPGGGHGHGADRAARPRRKRGSAWLAIGTAVVIIAAVAVILAITSPGGGGTPSAQPSQHPRPAATSPTPPAGQWGFIGIRKTDPVPLTLPELYPATFSNAGVVYTKARGVKGSDCHAALIGTDLQAAVKRGDCTQALRATYLSKTAKEMATIGVFNLKTAALASKAALKAGRSEFVAQLAAKAGPAKAIGQGTGIEEALVKGHYLILVWAESTDLTAPVKGKAARARFEAFMHLLISRTVNASLSSRMVDGKPARSG